MENIDINGLIDKLKNDYVSNPTLDKLHKLRKAMVDIFKANNSYDGFLRLLTELYPDNAHFIYELLQNAEDAQAKIVTFILSSESVEFDHDGEKLFKMENIDAITNIALSTKRDDNTSIGKFGVGFKAVFAYTETPEIYSGNYSFKIHDLVIPEDMKTGNKQEDTRFVFPFNSKNKTPNAAVSEIENGLRSLDDNAILFLDKISKIEYILPDCEALGYLERNPLDDGTVQITTTDPEGKKSVNNYLIYHKTVTINDDEDNKSKECRVSIAYQLEKKKGSDIWEIVPAENGQVCIFFPAISESKKANLKFHIHAPFASTVARDSVRSIQANKKLLEAIAELTSESLIDIKNRKLLTVDFLATLPIPDDNPADFYQPIRRMIVEKFRVERLVPTKSGTHAAAKDLFKAPLAEISDIFDDEELSFLINQPQPLWAKNAPQRNQREDKFLSSLKMREWGWNDICKIVNSRDQIISARIEKLVSEHDAGWTMRLYALLNDLPENYKTWLRNTFTEQWRRSYEYEQHLNKNIIKENLKIIRCKKEGSIFFTSPADAYLGTDQVDAASLKYNFVDPDTYSAGNAEQRKKDARSFLEKAGVRPYDQKLIVQLKLKQYDSNPTKDIQEHILDIIEFVNFWKKTNDCDIFSSHAFIRTESDTVKYSAPNGLYLDNPYVKTGLKEIVHIIEKQAIWQGYKSELNEEQLADFIEMLQQLPVFRKFDVIETTVENNPRKGYLRAAPGWRTSTEKDIDYTIEHIEEYLKLKSFAISKLIWSAAVEAKEYMKLARYYSNQSKSDKARTADSQLVYHLKNYKWIPDKAGNFCKPSETTKELLPENFTYNDKNGILTSIGFGLNAKYASETVKALGLNIPDEEAVAILESVKEMFKAGMSVNEIINSQRQATIAKKRGKPAFPTQKSSDPERRKGNVLEEFSLAPEKAYDIKPRSIKIPGTDIDSREYLRNHYTNDDKVMVCQMCENEMPFKKRNGEYYFVCTEMIGNEIIKKSFEAKDLALCPTCDAKYKEYIIHNSVETQREVLEKIKQSKPKNESDEIIYTIDVEIEGRPQTIRFAPIHMGDIKTIIEEI